MMKFLITFMIFTSLIKTEPSADLIKEMRERISQINILFLKNDYPNNSNIDELDKLLNTLKQEKKLPKAYLTMKDYENEKEGLIKSFKTFEKFYRSKPVIDTLNKVFRVVNNEFNTLFGNYFLDELKNSSKKKIIIFSTSMSCECTLEMCYKQESETQILLKENSGLFDYAVVDSYSNYDFQNEYKVGFIPTIILIDSNNKELKRFVRDENLYSELNTILKTKAYKND